MNEKGRERRRRRNEVEKKRNADDMVE